MAYKKAADGITKTGKTKGRNLGDSGPTAKIQKMCKGGKAMKYAKGGSASSRADGVASKGKTKAKQVTMCGGGKVKK